MNQQETLVQALKTCEFELGEGMTSFPPEDFWKRPAPALLSAGELVAHMAYGLVATILGPERATPLADHRSRYYFYTVDEPFQLQVSPEEAFDQLKALLRDCIAEIEKLNPDMNALSPFREDWTWGQALEYMVFHMAYHTGQLYSVRHLLGHETVDN